MSINCIDLTGREFRTDKGISWNTQNIHFTGFGVKQCIHDNVGQLLGIIDTAAQNGNGVFLQWLDVIFGQIFRIDGFFRSVVPCLQGCLVAVKTSRIARCIGYGNACNQTDSSQNRSSNFLFYTQNFCPQTMLAIL